MPRQHRISPPRPLAMLAAADADPPNTPVGAGAIARFLRDNGLTLALLALFLVSVGGQALAGWRVENESLIRHGLTPLGLGTYLASASFMSAVFENWESEFLQMATYVVLTAVLVQRGSAESREPGAPARDADAYARAVAEPHAPAALRAGAAVRWLYAHSLGIALFALFVGSFVVHWVASARANAAEALAHGASARPLLEYFFSSQLWFESFQNWQSEFLSTAVLVVLSIFLRQRESPESKPLAAPHGKTGP